MKYKLVFSDFDNTMGHGPEGIVPKETIDAINRYVERGGKFVICTGRMHSFMDKFCRREGIKGIVISYQGAMINEIESGKDLYVGGLDKQVAIKIAHEILEEGLELIVEVDDILYYEKKSGYTDFYRASGCVELKLVPSLIEFLEKNDHPILKLCGVGHSEEIKLATDKFNKKYESTNIIFNNGSSRLLEVVDTRCSKGFAARFVADYYGIPLSEVMTIGDSTNDLELIKGEWHGVAVGNAVEELKAVAKEVTVDFKDNPIKTLLEKYCL